MANTLYFNRYQVEGLGSVAVICKDLGPGIYILEFSDGSQYVGQTLHFATRFWQHRHGGKHHEAWGDIVALSVMEVPVKKLDDMERRVIHACQTSGIRLRNKQYNFGHDMPSPFDDVISIVERRHWVNGNVKLDLEAFRQASLRSEAVETKLSKSPRGRKWVRSDESEENNFTVAEAVCAALAQVIRLIPKATELEGKYWTISDFPSTAGGRFATLNVGRLELLYVPRDPLTYYDKNGKEVSEYFVHVNFPSGTFIRSFVKESKDTFDVVEISDGGAAFVTRSSYSLVEVDTLIVPLDCFATSFHQWNLEKPLLQLIVNLMVDGPSGMFSRWHSKELARCAYGIIAEVLA